MVFIDIKRGGVVGEGGGSLVERETFGVLTTSPSNKHLRFETRRLCGRLVCVLVLGEGGSSGSVSGGRRG